MSEGIGGKVSISLEHNLIPPAEALHFQQSQIQIGLERGAAAAESVPVLVNGEIYANVGRYSACLVRSLRMYRNIRSPPMS